MAAPKEYGLIKRGSKSDVIQPRLSIFDDDSDEDGHASVGKTLKREADRIQAKKQVKLNIQNALSEDPTVFEYDEVYDDMVQKKQEEIGLQKKKTEKKSRYIDSLLKAAKSRTLDQERSYERKIQKERIAEGEQFAGKESFVTSAYKKKMQEMQEQEEKERREAQIEALTDVTKQKDLSGFYRHLYRQTLGPKTETKEPTIEIKQEAAAAASNSDSESNRREDQSLFNSKPSSSKGERRPRQFRRRRESSSSSDDDDEQIESKGDTSRKRSKSKDSSSSDGESSQLDTAKDNTKARSISRERVASSSSSHDGQSRPTKRSKSDSSESKTRTSKDESSSSRDKCKSKDNRMEKEGEKVTKEPVISARDRLLALFKKRNVGEAFELAKERYFARREARNAMLAAFS